MEYVFVRQFSMHLYVYLFLEKYSVTLDDIGSFSKLIITIKIGLGLCQTK